MLWSEFSLRRVKLRSSRSVRVQWTGKRKRLGSAPPACYFGLESLLQTGQIGMMRGGREGTTSASTKILCNLYLRCIYPR